MIAATGSLSLSDPVNADSVENYIELGKFQSAKNICEYDLKKIRISKGDNNPEYAIRLGQLGFILLNLGDFKKSEEYLNQSIEKLKSFPTYKQDLATTIGYRGDWHYFSNDNISAAKDFETSYQINSALHLKENKHLELAIYNLAFIYSQLNKFNKSEKLYLELIDIQTRLYGERSVKIADINYEIGILYYKMGDYYKSEKYYLNALGILENYDDSNKSTLADIKISLVNLYTDLNNFPEAQKYLSFVESYTKEIRDTDIEIYLIYSEYIASYHYDKGNFEKAEKIFKEVLEAKKTIYIDNSIEIRTTNLDMAKLYNRKGDYKAAKFYIDKVLEFYDRTDMIDEYDYAIDLNIAGIIYETNEEYDKALEYFEKSLELKQKNYRENAIELGYSYFNCAGFNTNKNKERADKYFKKAIEIYEYNISEVMPYLTEAEQERYWFDIRTHLEVFQSYVIKHNRTELFNNLANISLNNKGRILGSQQTVREKSINDPEIRSKYTKLRSLKEFMAYTFKKSKGIEEKLKLIDLDSLNDVIRNLEKEILDHIKAIDDISNKNWEDILRELSVDQAVVDIVRIRDYDYINDPESDNRIPGFTNKIFYAAIIYRGDVLHPIFVLIDSLNRLENKTINEYHSLTDKFYLYLNQIQSIEEVEHSLSEIYDCAWSKIDKFLSGIKTIFVSPDGIYHSINLNTLMNSSTGEYLLDKYNIHLISSLKDFHNQSDINTDTEIRKTAVLIGNPDFKYNKIVSKPTDDDSDELDSFVKRGLNKNLTRSGIKRLPATEKEINLISNLLKESGFIVTKYLDSEATEDNLKLISGPSILHIATHGYMILEEQVNKDLFGFKKEYMLKRPLLRSMLLFAGAWNSIVQPDIIVGLEDGIFTAYEARNLNLHNTKLVVLSSCMSGLGDIKNGEGVYGLQRSFILAGAKHLLMSLWQVDDNVTFKLMKEFYQNYLNSNNIEEAFIAAQNSIRKTHPHFYYWGSFILISN